MHLNIAWLEVATNATVVQKNQKQQQQILKYCIHSKVCDRFSLRSYWWRTSVSRVWIVMPLTRHRQTGKLLSKQQIKLLVLTGGPFFWLFIRLCFQHCLFIGWFIGLLLQDYQLNRFLWNLVDHLAVINLISNKKFSDVIERLRNMAWPDLT